MGTQEGPAQEGETQGRVRLRPKRGFPLGLAQQRRPHKFSARLSIFSRRPNKVLSFHGASALRRRWPPPISWSTRRNG
jgi:hypothetical protein